MSDVLRAEKLAEFYRLLVIHRLALLEEEMAAHWFKDGQTYE